MNSAWTYPVTTMSNSNQTSSQAKAATAAGTPFPLLHWIHSHPDIDACDLRELRAAPSPARRVLRQAEAHHEQVGHENAGFLSWDHGFTPRVAPLTQLTDRFEAWDQLARELPHLHRTLRLRKAVEQMPTFDASELPEAQLLRAAALLAITAHAYWYVDVTPPERLPPSLGVPWQQVRARLGRKQEVLSYIDLIIYNWRYKPGCVGEPRDVENLTLLLPTVDNQSEHVFYLTQVEILARATPIVRALVEAQDAVLRDDPTAVERSLVAISTSFEPILASSLPKISAHPYSPTYVDPVVWAKTVAPMAVPIHSGHQGPSGTTSPIFNTLDLFFGRKRYESFLGREIQLLREHYPPAWQAFLHAVSQVSVSDYVARCDRPSLRRAYREALDMYCGDQGFLGRHRVKVYGFLELAFKVGRSVTIGGFSGVFRDRTWDQVDEELEQARVERPASHGVRCQHARVTHVASPCVAGADRSSSPTALHRIRLELPGSNITYRVGDRCAVLPEHSPELVARTLQALGASGEERVPLTREWQAAMQTRFDRLLETLPVKQLLRYGTLRPLLPRIAEALHARTQSPVLREALQRGNTENWELWQLLEQLRASGVPVSTLWQDENGRVDRRLSCWLPPERFRPYSICSLPDGDGSSPPSLEIMVGQLSYANPQSNGAPGIAQQGTASAFLVRAAEAERRVPFRIERPTRFHLPEDAERPIVLFAGGTGISPCRALIQQRLRERSRGPTWLLASLRSPEQLQYAPELNAPLAQGALRFDAAFTREGASLRLGADGALHIEPGERRRIGDVMLTPAIAAQLWHWLTPRSQGGLESAVYICGRGGFAKAVLDALTRVFERHLPGDRAVRQRRAMRQLCELSGQDRLQLEIHNETSQQQTQRWLDFSQVAQHNDAEHGYWMVIDRIVYDVTRLLELHPGGSRVLQAYAGMDATQGFARAHPRQPDVDAMREMYRIGLLRPLKFDDSSARVESPSGPVQVTCSSAYGAWQRGVQLVVEMQNALDADHDLQHSCAIADGPPKKPTRYQRARAIESHHRFLSSYLQPLLTQTFPGLFDICQALFAEAGASRLVTELERVWHSRQAIFVHRASQKLLHQLSQMTDEELAHQCELLLARDRELLARIKHIMIEGLRQFERYERHLRQLGGARLVELCAVLTESVETYYGDLGPALGLDRPSRPPVTLRPLTQVPGPDSRRLHASEYWLFDEYVDSSTAMLRRSPIPPLSLESMARDNEKLLAALSERHRDFGLVVDTRQAPIRNDTEFERAMGQLRERLTRHFSRTAILIDSRLGELQVARLERDEGRSTLVTRSEGRALRFARGGS